MELIRVQDSDYRKAYELYMTFDEDENGFVNSVYGYDYDKFLEWIEMKRNWSMGKGLPEGFVPDTSFVLSVDGEYVGVFNLRHYLNDFLRNGPGHIGYGISKKYRRKGYATAGLKLALGKAREIGIHEAYLSVNKDNTGSLKTQLNNGAYIHHEDDKKYYTRIDAISESDSREKIVCDYYNQTDEDGRLDKSRHGQLEYATTMHYIHRFADKGSKILEVGAATGRYSIALAKEGFDVTAVDLVEKNIEILKKNNVHNINNSLISFLYAVELGKADDALGYVKRSIIDFIISTTRTTYAASFAYAKKHDDACIASLSWLTGFLDSLKADAGTLTYTDKLKAISLALMSIWEETFGYGEQAEEHIKQAYDLAAAFDAAPVNSARGLMFINDVEGTLVDSFGDTVCEAVENYVFGKVPKNKASRKIRALWDARKG